jgi:hypothetical protein
VRVGDDLRHLLSHAFGSPAGSSIC